MSEKFGIPVTNETCEPAHDHDHGHDHGYKAHGKKKLLLSMAITLAVMLLELVGGFVTNSVALLSDAGHMFTHFFALLISYVAIRIAGVDPCHHRTYGFFRAEVLAALLNGIFLLVVTGIILYESVERMLAPEAVASREMFIIATIGLVVNLVTLWLLESSRKGDRNIRAAFVHMMADALSSVGVVGGAVVIHYTGLTIIDPLLAVLISVLIVTWGYGLIKDSVRVLMEIAPAGLDTGRLTEELLKGDDRIVEVADMHVIEITEGLYDLSAVLAVDTDSLEVTSDISSRARQLLATKFNIGHATIECIPRHKAGEWQDHTLEPSKR
jgi:cobalt-zinc-cadmium efflux system protein